MGAKPRQKNEGSSRNSGKLKQRTHASGAPEVALAVQLWNDERRISGHG